MYAVIDKDVCRMSDDRWAMKLLGGTLAERRKEEAATDLDRRHVECTSQRNLKDDWKDSKFCKLGCKKLDFWMNPVLRKDWLVIE